MRRWNGATEHTDRSLHEELTNKQLADRLGQDPATILHHVRTLCRRGFLEAGTVPNGRRGALEQPCRATGKSWVLSVDQPADRLTPTIEALRDEILAAGADSVAHNSRVGLRLNEAEADELNERIADLVEHHARRRPTSGGDRLGFDVSLHRLDPPAAPAAD